MDTPKIGFIGLGLMGAAMVECLQKAGYSLVVLGNRDRTGIEAALGRGATEAATAREIPRGDRKRRKFPEQSGLTQRKVNCRESSQTPSSVVGLPTRRLQSPKTCNWHSFDVSTGHRYWRAAAGTM